MRNSIYVLSLLALLALLSELGEQPKLDLSIAGLKPGMTKAQVEAITGRTLEDDGYLIFDKVEVMLDKGRVNLVMGPELNCDGRKLRPTNMEVLEAVLGPADSKPPHEDPICVYAALGFEFYRHSLGGHIYGGEELEGQFVLGLEPQNQPDTLGANP